MKSHSIVRFIVTPLFLFCTPLLFGQIITTSPELPIDNGSVKIIFDAAQGNAALKDYTGDVYAHTGVLTDKSSGSGDWKYVKNAWGVNTPETKLTRIDNNTYELNISNIRSYYGVPSSEKILKLAFVFRSADSQKEGKEAGNKDIFYDVYEDKFALKITSNKGPVIIALNEEMIVSAASTQKASFTLLMNETQIKSLTDTSRINDTLSFTTPGDYWIKIKSTAETQTLSDSVYVSVHGDQNISPLPEGVRMGINYINNQTVTLVLYAPFKQSAYVIGDFNNWLPSANYRMNKDGDRFWITINNLEPQKEYIFQYLVDGVIRIADPYSEKISDPYEDHNIASTTYPNLIAYPSGKTYERASVIQTGQSSYSWKNTSYTIPGKKDLVIYELLIRDFTTEGTIKAAKEKLAYLKDLGINAVELMPFNEFEGNVSWGYNPNFYFAPDKAYGTKTDYKDFIDACHEQGIIVIQDIVLNHAYGSTPFARLYWDAANNRPAADNPWFNVTSPNTIYSWGCDFNHQSTATKQFIDSVAKFWMNEYKIDGFRYDFAKGFTNTPGDGSAYDAQRIENLKRIADVVWQANPKAYVILELFAPNDEEKLLATYNKGMLIWGNANSTFSEASKGFHDGNRSNFSWASASSRGYSQPGLVTYMESHDEERIMYRNLTEGNSSGNYTIRYINNALRRAGMSAAFLLSIPGPKMIWQFGELGYDISINYIDRTAMKPVHWEYYDNSERFNSVFKVYRAMIDLRKQYPVFTEGSISMTVGSALKRINLAGNDMNVSLIGNFGVAEGDISGEFAHTGTWYEYFSGNPLEVTSTSQQVTLQAGEYRMYTDKILPAFNPTTSSDDKLDESITLVYPNPANDVLFISTEQVEGTLEVLNSNGKQVKKQTIDANVTQLVIGDLTPGLYLLRATNKQKVILKKFVKL
jgi:1,4-alpha-glucan branching enzyme